MSQLLLALDATGYPTHWMTWQDAVIHDVLGKIAYGFGDFEFTFRGGLNRSTGLESRVTLKSILVLHGHSRLQRAKTTIPLTNAALFRRDGHVCAYCGKVGARSLTRDHIIPVSRGGADRWLNVVSCCLSCNIAKGSQTLDELGWELLYVPYAPTHQEGLILENRRILADQMDLLKGTLPKHSRILGQ
jgi:hypothetical protein